MRIGLSMPIDASEIDLSQFTGSADFSLDDVQFEVVGERASEPLDAWFVVDDTLSLESSAEVESGKLFYLSAESINNLDFLLARHKQRFLAQFTERHSCYPTMQSPSYSEYPFLPWMVNANHGSVFRPHQRDLTYLVNMERPQKSKQVSVICSNKTITPEQRLRLRFTEGLVKIFGSELDWFGNGVNHLAEKWSGLSDYKVTISLENRQTPGFFTEKIFDPFLTWTTPVYWGPLDVGNYLPIERWQILDIRDLDGSVKTVKAAIARSEEESNYEKLR